MTSAHEFRIAVNPAMNSRPISDADAVPAKV
jgi:hypothetical protein